MADDAIDFDQAVHAIADVIAERRPQDVEERFRAGHLELSLSAIITGYWRQRGRLDFHRIELSESMPFADAASHLVTIGVLRHGFADATAPTVGGSVVGDRFAVTARGLEWAATARDRAPVDPGAFAARVAPYVPLFGSVFEQRCREAAGCFRSGLYLATCVMAGTAVECIAVAAALHQGQDEEQVLALLRAGQAGPRLLGSLTGNLKKHVRDRIQNCAAIVNHWRNDAAHGASTEITAGEAHHALDCVLIIAQQVERHWALLQPAQASAKPAEGT